MNIMPPTTLEAMLENLNNPNFKTYIVLGDGSDDASQTAEGVGNIVPGLELYLVKPDAQAAVKQHFNPPEGHIGIVCSRDGSVARTLTQDEASSSIAVTQAISNA